MTSKTAERVAWRSMITRCMDKNRARYGGRGISVCERWRLSFTDFLTDVGKRPSRHHSIDRIDNNGNYEPGNVRWATRLQQAANQTPRAGIPRDRTKPMGGAPKNTADSIAAKKQRRARAGIVVLRDGSRDETILMRCSPKLKAQVQAVASKLGVSIGRALEELAAKGLKR